MAAENNRVSPPALDTIPNQHRYALLFAAIFATIFIHSLMVSPPGAPDPSPPLADAIFQRRTYTWFVILLLPFCYAATKSFQRGSVAGRRHLLQLTALGWAALCAAMVPAVRALAAWVLPVNILNPSYLIATATAFAIFLIWIDRRDRSAAGAISQQAWRTGILICAAVIFSYCVSGISALNDATPWATNFDAVAYSISQVAAGKTLLADLPAQYGLYATFIAPILRATGFSIVTVTGIFGALSACAFLALAYVAARVVQSWAVKTVWLATALLLSNFVWAHFNDPYLQYFPLRTIFPAISVLLFWRYLDQSSTAAYSALIGAVSGFGIAWNVDSGIPCLGAFLGYVVLATISGDRADRRRLAWHGLASVMGAIIAIAMFVAYMEATANATIHWSEVFHYQKLFYLNGAYTILMPVYPHPWMAVIATYVACIVVFMARTRSKTSLWRSLCLYLAIMGLGLFPYYQHRAHDLVLGAVAWPALLCAAILADRLLGRIRRSGWMSIEGAVMAPPTIAAVIIGGYLVWLIPIIGLTVAKHWETVLAPAQTPFTRNVDFIRTKMAISPDRAPAIFAPNQASIYGLLGIASPIPGPGIIESFEETDKLRLAERLKTIAPELVFVRPGEGFDYALLDSALTAYRLQATSEDGMKLYRLTPVAPR